MRIQFENQEIELEDSSTGFDLAKKLHRLGPEESLAVSINGTIRDLTTPLSEGDVVSLVSFDSPEGKDIFWHTSAHVLAQAILRLWPDAQPTIGPPIENGFYYDFANLHINEEDFGKIEKEVQKIVKENHKSERVSFSGKEEALREFGGNPYKVELIEGFDEEGEFSGYRQGEFFDLCRGPHMPNLGKIKAFKVLKTAGAYWKGDSNREMLTRVYATSYPDRKLLKEYLQRLEEAKKRDHKILGPRLDLFSLREEAPGMPFFHPKGMILWNHLMNFWKECHDRAHYVEIKTPIMMTQELWERSGHWSYYRDNMFTSSIEERDYAIKPMNCPGCMLFYKSKVHSYRELPWRVAEIGTVHRYEPSGAISGLLRVRCFHQDDAHIFMKPEDIEEEILGVLALVDEIYSAFGLDFHLELSTRPEKDTVGTDEEWERATAGLKGALDRSGRNYVINEGDGAFYGPKIDVHIRDAIGRTWQCATIQLDMSLPERFDLEYSAADGSRQRPIMIHRALFGSIERFIAILIEHFAGRFPLWLSPRHIRILSVADRHAPRARELQDLFRKEGFHVEVDEGSESVGKKVRNAQLDQVNYILTIGDKELENQTVGLRTRDNVVHGEVDVTSFVQKLKQEIDSRSLSSPYSQ